VVDRPETVVDRPKTMLDRPKTVLDRPKTMVDPGALGNRGAAAPPADPRLASAPAPTERPVPLPPPEPPQPKPTFTASKPAEQAAPPPFSSSRPAPGAAPQQTPSFSAARPAKRADPPTTPEPAYGSQQWSGPNAPNAPYANSGGQYGGPGGQYPGPSRDYPDLARQYAPGTGGRPRRRRGRTLGIVIAAIVIAAGAGAGAAYALHGKSTSSDTTPPPTPSGSASTSPAALPATLPWSVRALDTPSDAVPPGYTTVTIQPSDSQTTAGFSIDIPPGWTETRPSALVVRLTDGNGDRVMDIDLTQHTYPNMVTEANYVSQQSVAEHKFPDYHLAHLSGEPVQGTAGAFWQFTYLPASAKVTYRADDIFWIAQTSAGPQSFAIFFKAPDKGWNAKFKPVFETILHSFKTIPS
jgi:hypothetical protein